MTTIARAFQAVRSHIPMIKFPNRSEVMAAMVNSTSMPSPPSQIPSTPAASSSKPGGAKSRGAGIEYVSLPKKYQRPPLTPEEIAYIERGGPE